jgi:hypothetical protein
VSNCPDGKAQREMLSEEASATWRRLTLRHNGDKRIGQMNFIQALLTDAQRAKYRELSLRAPSK